MKKLLFGLLMTFAFAATSAAQSSTDCGCEDKRLSDVLGLVNGVKITRQDLSPETRARVEQLQREVIDARKRELDLQIDSILLEAEAKKRKVPSSQVLKDEVIAKIEEPAEAEDDIRYQRQQELARKLAERLRATAQLKVLARPSAPPVDRARLLAVVNGKRITAGDIETSLQPLILSVQKQVYALRKQDLDLKINDTLLTQEAQKRQITSQALLEAEVNAKVPRVTEAQAQEFYQQNKERISGEFAQTRDQIVQYMQESRDREATLAYAQKLRSASVVQINLPAPESPVR